MQSKTILFLLLASLAMLLGSSVNAQAIDDNMRQYKHGFIFEKGIYLSFLEFKENKPSLLLPFERDGSSILIYNDSAKKMMHVNPDKVWGYSDGGNVYIAQEGGFWKLINIGKLTQFSAIVITRVPTVDAFGFPVDRYSKLMNQLFFDFDDGIVKKLNKENMLPYLESELIDPKRLKKNLKREEGLILALKAINQVQPIYFPVYE